jgi:hypothetical protein
VNGRSLVLIPAALALACLPRQSSDQSELTPDPTPQGGLERRCSPSSTDTITLLEAPSPDKAPAEAPCGVALEFVEGELILRAIPSEGEPGAQGVVLGRGLAPERCGEALERCELWGVHDELGPLVFVAERGSESEVPVQIYLGWVADSRLAFAPTWYGLPSIADHTRVGPPWALAPYACDGALALLPTPRLPEAAVEAPSEAVREAAGRWSIGEDGASPVGSGSVLEADRCRPVFTAIP